jgi:hypothetical protein
VEFLISTIQWNVNFVRAALDLTVLVFALFFMGIVFSENETGKGRTTCGAFQKRVVWY